MLTRHGSFHLVQSAMARTVNGGFAHQIRTIKLIIKMPLMQSTALVASR